MTEWPGKADMLSFQITFDLCKASGNELAQFSDQKSRQAREGKKALTFLLIFISWTLEIVSGEKKTPA